MKSVHELRAFSPAMIKAVAPHAEGKDEKLQHKQELATGCGILSLD